MQFKCFLLKALKTTDIHFISLNHVTVQARCYALSSSSGNPYEILGLKSTCTSQDVKKAYLKLCKELHPDMKPGDASQHKKFVELNNAYTILINAKSRSQVDYKHSSRSDDVHDTYQWTQSKGTSRPFEHSAWQKDEEWYEREDYKNQFPQQNREINNPTYSKTRFTLIFCFLLMCVGSLLHFSAYRYATNITLKTVDERSRKINEGYQDIRKNALSGDRKEQFEKLKKKWGL